MMILQIWLLNPSGRSTRRRAIGVAKRGEVWQVDFGITAKVRPALVISIPYSDSDRALVGVIPHTTAKRGSQFSSPNSSTTGRHHFPQPLSQVFRRELRLPLQPEDRRQFLRRPQNRQSQFAVIQLLLR